MSNKQQYLKKLISPEVKKYSIESAFNKSKKIDSYKKSIDN